MTHEEIRIALKIEDKNTKEVRLFEAVGFLKKRGCVKGDEMLSRTERENNGAIKEEDTNFFLENSHQLPKELRDYFLVTSQRNPNRPLQILFFYWHHRKWRRSWRQLDNAWSRYCLIVRRCA